MDRVALDTTFLIDLQNERRARGAVRGAMDFLRAHGETELLLPSVSLGEYLEGFDDPEGDDAQAVVANLTVLPVTTAVARAYAAVARRLRDEGRMIGANDLWIACCARCEGIPLVTRNTAEFRRVPALEVVGYSATPPAE